MSLKDWLQRAWRRTSVGPRLDEAAAIQFAQAFAERQSLRFEPPVQAEFDAATSTWRVCTNVGKRGSNLRLVIDDATGRVEKHSYMPR